MIVGDTPNDVKAALAAGVDVIAVATCKRTKDELRAAGAIRLTPDLGDFLRCESHDERFQLLGAVATLDTA
ncbi:HAD family hydrolase [Amycolatopsis sp. NPDC051903]|uniref:HAD family hydrolase n=1 Tax=Amycolatopsis sp. NPDC051903 TaxID=3363936 RepID=UPI00378C533C